MSRELFPALEGPFSRTIFPLKFWVLEVMEMLFLGQIEGQFRS